MTLLLVGFFHLTIQVYFPASHPTANRLANFDVQVGGLTSTGRLCHRQETAVAAGAWLHMDCPTPLPGRVVTVQIFAPDPIESARTLSMCEVKVMADGMNNPLDYSIF